MERYVRTCRLILCCENLSKVIEPLRSRCLAIRVAAPSREEICGIVTTVAKREGVAFSAQAAGTVADASRRNLRRALLMAEAQRVAGDDASAVQLPDWELFIKELASKITTSQTPQTLLDARQYLYELLGNCIPASTIFQTLVRYLMPSLDEELRQQTVHWAAHYEHRLQQGDKGIYHLEAFIAKFMLLYKEYLMRMFC